MNFQARGIGLSLLVHITALSVFWAFASFTPIKKKIISLDFSILENHESGLRPAPVSAVKQAEEKPVNRSKKRPKPVIKKKKLPELAKPAPAVKKEAVATVSVPVEKTEAADTEEETPLKERQEVEQVREETPAEPEKEENVSVEDQEARETANTATSVAATESSSTSGAGAKERYLKSHFLYIKEEIQKNLFYPRLARRRGWEGKVVLSFMVCKDGSVRKIKIVESSGYKLLDKSAVETVNRAAPFPKPPIMAEIIIPISFEIG